MKKLLGISLVSVLAAVPMMANAETTPVHTDDPDLTAAAPGYALVTIDTSANSADNNAASAGYVKGAYNAAIKAVNKVNAKVDAIDTGVQTVTEGTTGGAVSVDGTAVSVHTDASHRWVSDTEKNTWNAKQGALSTDQMAAVNSGITSAKVSGYDTLKSNVENATTGLAAAHDAIGTINDSAVMKSGITAAKVSGYDTVKSNVENATTGLAAAHTAIGTINSSAPMTSGITAAKVQSYDGLVTAAANYATKEGVAATVDKATASKTGASLNVNFGAITNTHSLSAAVPTGASYKIMRTWGSDTATDATYSLTGSGTGAVTGSITTSIAASTATGDITGIDVSVGGYYDNAADTTAQTF